jgi:RHS repeat-associated protein
VTNNLNTSTNFTTAVEPNNNTTGTPQAYLTILFFDERFNFIAAADGGLAQAQVRSTDAGNANAQPLALPNIQAPRNGYAYIYISNRSDQDVYFDNLTINVAAGRIVEEDHYYALGLKIAAISSHKLGDGGEGKLSNPYQFNDKEMLDEDAGLNWYDYGFRNYDPQTGRFVQLDPMADDYPTLTPYQFAGNDPVANVDLDGLEPAVAIGDGVVHAAGDFSYAYGAVDDMRQFVSATHALGATASAVKGAEHLALTLTSVAIHMALIGTEIINVKFVSHDVGNPDPYSQGLQDATKNVISFGAHDFIARLLGRDPLEQFDNDYDRYQYLKGRLHVDYTAVVLGEAAKDIGGGIAAGGLSTGPFAAAISAGGIILAGVGEGVQLAATGDALWATAQLLQIEIRLKAAQSDPLPPSTLKKDYAESKGPPSYHEHHPYPKAVGGDPDQETVTLLDELHLGEGGVHDDIRKFEGGWLFPKKGYSGAQIVKKFGSKKIIEGLRRFYSQPKWRFMLQKFEDAVKFTIKNAKK